MAPEDRGLTKPNSSRRADLYALGGVLYFLATGKSPELNLPENAGQLKRYVNDQINSSNPSLLSQNCGIVDIISHCLRQSRDLRIPDAEALLQEIETFRPERPSTDYAVPPVSGTLRNWPYEQLQNIKDTVTKLMLDDGNPFFSRIARFELRRLESSLVNMSRGTLVVSGSRERIVSAMTQYLSVLQSGDAYLAVSTAAFWSARNMGVNGRYLSMTRLIAQRGVEIRRIFLLSEEELRNAEVMAILEAHNQLQTDLPETSKHNMRLRVAVFDKEEYVDHLSRDLHRGTWIKSIPAMMVRIIPTYYKGIITAIRLQESLSAPGHARSDFGKMFDKAQDLKTWLNHRRPRRHRRKPPRSSS